MFAISRQMIVEHLSATETLRGDAQLAEMKFMLSIPLARESVRRAHTLSNQLKKHTLWRYELSSAIFYGIMKHAEACVGHQAPLGDMV